MTTTGGSCTDPDFHVDDPEQCLAAVRRACNARGLRLTPIRERILQLIVQAKKPVKAYDLLQQARARQGAGADAPATIYRALDFLVAHGFVHKLCSINAYVACHHPGSAGHSVPFLICSRCQAAVELEDRDIVAQLQIRAHDLGFMPHAQTLEVHGLCRQCARTESKDE